MTSPPPTVEPAEHDSDPGTLRLPTVSCDPIASLSPVPIEVYALDRTWTVPAMSAEDWLRILWRGEYLDPELIFPGLVGAYDLLYEALFDGTISVEEAFEISMEVLEEASGYRWWYTLRAATFIRSSWSRLAGLVALDPARTSLGMYITSYIGIAVQNIPPKNAVRLVEELVEVPPAYAEREFDEAAELQAFLDAMS